MDKQSLKKLLLELLQEGQESVSSPFSQPEKRRFKSVYCAVSASGAPWYSFSHESNLQIDLPPKFEATFNCLGVYNTEYKGKVSTKITFGFTHDSGNYLLKAGIDTVFAKSLLWNIVSTEVQTGDILSFTVSEHEGGVYINDFKVNDNHREIPSVRYSSISGVELFGELRGKGFPIIEDGEYWPGLKSNNAG